MPAARPSVDLPPLRGVLGSLRPGWQLIGEPGAEDLGFAAATTDGPEAMQRLFIPAPSLQLEPDQRRAMAERDFTPMGTRAEKVFELVYLALHRFNRYDRYRLAASAAAGMTLLLPGEALWTSASLGVFHGRLPAVAGPSVRDRTVWLAVLTPNLDERPWVTAAAAPHGEYTISTDLFVHLTGIALRRAARSGSRNLAAEAIRDLGWRSC